MTTTEAGLEIAIQEGGEDADPVFHIQPPTSWASLELRDLWEYRDLLYILTVRDIIVRYKQTVLGLSWAILQPLLTMLIFTMVFGNLAGVPSEGLPYPIFALTALLPWNYFAQALGRSGASLVGNAPLISKVYFPRLIMPLSAVITPLAEFAVAFLILLGMMAWYGIAPTRGMLALPLLLLWAAITALAVGLWLSALYVRYRDIGHILPFIIQIGMYLSPVAYPASLVPARWRPLYSLNPMAGVIEGFRWALLGQSSLDLGASAVGTALVLALLFGGIVYFRKTEDILVDVI
ncbi:MAG: ABC transporter permease [Isosphaeraceae bacterium]|nr:ABC transporter permease [Isosphaeraceae bacterium]